MIGKTISHYKILDKLGEGGMGVVYKAEDTKLKRTVALKFLASQSLGTPEEKTRFVHEAQSAAALDHPNICTVYEIDEADGHTFIAMAYVDGESLREKTESGPLKLEEALSLATDIARGLQEAHEKAIVHRDIKSANIMVTKNGHAKITDFGLAKLAGSTRVTKTGTTVGTAAYMSPEQALGEGVDHRSDIWSLGVVLYEMLTGQLPFRGDHEQAVTYQIVHEDAEPITAVRTGVPMELERIVNKCLEKEPPNRYQHVDELLVDLRKVNKAPPIKPRKNLFKYAIPGAVVLVAAALFFILNPFHIEFQKNQPIASGNTIGVIGFENLSNPDDSEHLGRMLMGLIITDLTESGGVNVASTSKVLAAYKAAGGNIEGGFDTSLAAETARRAGASTMLTGQVIESGNALLLTVELVDVESGNTLGSLKKNAASSAELFALAGAMAADVRARLGVEVKASVGRSFDLAQSLTDSPEAYRQYLAGEVALHQGDYSGAVNGFRLATKQDSTFAMAWYRLSMANDWLGDSEAGLVASTRSLQYLDRLPERWRVMCRAKNDYDKGDFDAAYGALSELVTTATDMRDAYNLLGEIVTHRSRYLDSQKARTYFEKALEIDPAFKVVFFHLIDDYLVAGDLEAAERLVARYKAEDPLDGAVVRAEIRILFSRQRYDDVIARVETQMRKGNLSRWYLLAQALAHRGEFDRAFTLADEATRRSVGSVRALALQDRGWFHYAQGRFRAAIADYRDATTLLTLEQPALANLANDIHLDHAYLLMLTEDIEGALAVLHEARGNDRFDPRPYFWIGCLSLDAGRHRETDDALNDLKAMSAESFSSWGEYWTYLFKAEMHRADGNLDAALTELEKASDLGSRSPPYLGDETSDGREMEWMVRARVLEARGDRTGAIAAYRDVLRPPDLNGSWSPRKIPVQYELARLLEAEGDLAAAREYYQTYVDCWGKADIPIPNVETAKTRLKVLDTR